MNPRFRSRPESPPPYPSARNLYLFVREVLGHDVSDNSIARRWKVDPRIFNDIKHGRVAVPRIERLRDLARVLGVNEHFAFAAGVGVPTRKLMTMVRRQDISSAVGVLVGAKERVEVRLKETQDALASKHRELERVSSELELRNVQLQALLEQLLVAVLTFDANGNVAHINPVGREIFGVDSSSPGVPLNVAMKGTVFLDLEGRPFDPMQLPGYQALTTRAPARRVFSVHRPGKKGRIVAATATPMRAGRRFIGVVSVLRDIEDIVAAVGGLGFDWPTQARVRRRVGKRRLDGRRA